MDSRRQFEQPKGGFLRNLLVHFSELTRIAGVYGKYIERIERSLANVLPSESSGGWLDIVAGVECPEASAAWADLFVEPARDILGRGGKRWRPLVTVLTCEALGGGEAADFLSAFTEILHNGSLIIDDIEDSSLMRRGAPAVHLVHGDDLAINAGNFMYFLPSIILDDLRFDGPILRDVTRDWLTVMRRLHLGQGYDILWHRRKELYPSQESYLCMCRFKTGSLAGLAAILGARAAQSVQVRNSGNGGIRISEEFVQRIGCIWEKLGTGFQILDDVQNLSSGIPGKDFGDDIAEGKKSLPVILHASSSPEDIPRLTELFHESAEKAPEGDWAPVEETIRLLNSSGSIDSSRVIGRDMLHEGIKEIENILPEHNSRNLLVGIIERFIDKML